VDQEAFPNAEIVSKAEWQRAHDTLLAKEEAAARARDALAAERPGTPQTPPYAWRRRHDEYGKQPSHGT
jgi:predicted dithiol-disulfide oxidoreductase (DUF899 family)